MWSGDVDRAVYSRRDTCFRVLREEVEAFSVTLSSKDIGDPPDTDDWIFTQPHRHERLSRNEHKFFVIYFTVCNFFSC